MSCLDENTVLAFFEGRLPRAGLDALEAHVATCEACRELVVLSAPAAMSVVVGGQASPLPLPAEPVVRSLARGATIGRYVVLGPVGSGAMGDVYAAFDPELNRKIALKLLRAHSETPAGRARLLREAQAIAKLQHPNVVVVHDAGTFDEHVFIAMEFIEGVTVRGWLKVERRSRREILDVYLAAGRGLAAAHARGLVHRDFKPDNVMVTNDGQVRVMDFGLARQLDGVDAPSADTAPALAPDDGAPPPNLTPTVSLKLTQTGAVVGTPAYMAPEQFANQRTDARTDQFSFCVALYEALYGKRPFEGRTLDTLIKNVMAGTAAAPPAKSHVPGWLRRVLLRGLDTKPERRFPSMGALLAALETDPTVRARRIAAGVALLACVGGGLALARQGAGSKRALCQGAGERWAGVWERGAVASARKDAIHRSFLATAKTYAEHAFVGASRTLDVYVEHWSAMYADACEATNIRGEQSEQVLDLRMGCLQERLTSAHALTDLFVNADGTVVENAFAAAGALPSLDWCADVPALRAVVKPPDEAARTRVQALRLERARLVALRDAGHCAEAERLAQDLIPRVRAVGYLPLVAETLSAAALLVDNCIAAEVGVERYRDAYVAAVASRLDDVAAESAIVVSATFADRLDQALPARQWLTVANAMLDRIGRPPRLQPWVLNAEFYVLLHEGRVGDAVGAARKAVATVEKLQGGEGLDDAIAHLSLGNGLESAARHEDAIRAFDQARAIYTRALGAQHPHVAVVVSNVGESLNALHRYAEARAAFKHALDIWRGSGSDPQFVAYALTGLGLATLGEDHAAEAVAPLDEAMRIRLDRHEGPAHLGEVRFALARALWSRTPDRPRALELARLARADYADVKGGAATVAAIDAWLGAPAARL